MNARRELAVPCDERCACGALVARLSPAGVELLCRRCKRIHIIPWTTRMEAPMPAEALRH